jgi:uncharacterized protein (DUF1499 family)
MAIISRFVKHPLNLGVQNGQLTPCDNMPNCVNSQSQDPRHQINPISYTMSSVIAQEKLLNIIQSTPRSEVIIEKPGYIYAEFRTKGMGYVDDVEFYFDEPEQVIHFRSGSRVPYYDFKVNRQRMEAIREAFIANTDSAP